MLGAFGGRPAQRRDVRLGGRLRQHPRMGPRGFAQQALHELDVGAARHLRHDTQPHRRLVVDLVGHVVEDEALVRHQHGEPVLGDDGRAARADLLDGAFHVADVHAVAHLERALQHDDDAADEVADDVLQAEADAHAHRAGQHAQRGEVEPRVLQDQHQVLDGGRVLASNRTHGRARASRSISPQPPKTLPFCTRQLSPLAFTE